MPIKGIRPYFVGILSGASRSSFVRDTVSTTLYVLIGKGAGFLIPFFIAAWFGVSSGMDAFFFAYAVIFFLATIFSAVVESVSVPFIAEARARGEDVGLFVGRILGTSAIGVGALSVAALLAARPVLTVVSRFDPGEIDLITVILAETAPLAVLLVWTSALSGALNAYGSFRAPALSPAFRAAVTLAFIYAMKDALGVHAIAWGYLAGEAARLLILFFIIRSSGLLRVRLAVSWDSRFREFLRGSSLQVAGMSLAVLSPLVDRVMASWLEPNSVSILEYSEKLFFVPSNLLSMGFLTVLLSKWSNEHYNDRPVANSGVLRLICIVAPILLVFTLAFFVFGGFLSKLVYGRGSISANDLDAITLLFGLYVLGLPAIIIGHVLARWMLVLKDMMALFKIGAFKASANALLNLVFIYYMGLPGIALSSTVTAFFAMALYYLYFRKTDKRVCLGLQGKTL